jgi:hypothetical protein
MPKYKVHLYTGERVVVEADTVSFDGESVHFWKTKQSDDCKCVIPDTLIYATCRWDEVVQVEDRTNGDDNE